MGLWDRSHFETPSSSHNPMGKAPSKADTCTPGHARQVAWAQHLGLEMIGDSYARTWEDVGRDLTSDDGKLTGFLVWFVLHHGPFWQTAIVSMWLSNSWGTSLEIFMLDFQLVGVVPAMCLISIHSPKLFHKTKNHSNKSGEKTIERCSKPL